MHTQSPEEEEMAKSTRNETNEWSAKKEQQRRRRDTNQRAKENEQKEQKKCVDLNSGQLMRERSMHLIFLQQFTSSLRSNHSVRRSQRQYHMWLCADVDSAIYNDDDDMPHKYTHAVLCSRCSHTFLYDSFGHIKLIRRDLLHIICIARCTCVVVAVAGAVGRCRRRGNPHSIYNYYKYVRNDRRW